MAINTMSEQKFNTSLIEKNLTGLQMLVKETEIKDDESLAGVATLIKNIKSLGKAIRDEMEKYTKPAKAIIDEARAKYRPYELACEEAETELKSKAQKYMIAQEDKRQKEEEKIAAKVEAGKLKEETGLKKMEALGEEKKTVVAESGAKLTLKSVKEVVIVNPNLVPDEYWKIDEVAVRHAALSGIVIPGVEIRESKQMSA